MRLFLLFVTIATWIANASCVQEPGLPAKEPGFYFRQFQHYTQADLRIDSAFYFLQKIAEDTAYRFIMNDLLYNSIVQPFMVSEQGEADAVRLQEIRETRRVSAALLDRMINSSNKRLAATAMPICLWVRMKASAGNVAEMKQIVGEMNKLVRQPDIFYTCFIGRYALMACQEMKAVPALKPSMDALFEEVMQRLAAGQVTGNPDSLSMKKQVERAWYRYLYGYCNLVKGQQLMERGLTKEAAPYFEKACHYSSDVADLCNRGAYFYDAIFLFDEENDSFADEYLSYLIQSGGDTQQILDVMLGQALLRPVLFRDSLRAFYTSNHCGDGQSFEQYWMKKVDSMAVPAPAFLLTALDSTRISLEAYKGKWVLLDFWGTWCMPCREELPGLEKFFQYVSTKHPHDFKIATVACHDMPDKVMAYMTEKQYHFPVVMDDTSISKNYRVYGYPSKRLITPNGKYLVIPFGLDWIAMVKAYAGL